jgi:hypothetical protein
MQNRVSHMYYITKLRGAVCLKEPEFDIYKSGTRAPLGMHEHCITVVFGLGCKPNVCSNNFDQKAAVIR